MTRKGSLSDFWRQDASDDRVRELTSVLRGSDSLLGVMGSGVRAVWSTNGKSQTWWVRTRQGQPAEMRVFLDYSPLRELIPPFHGEAVDEVIGYAAHEGGHCLWSSENSKDETLRLLQNSTSPQSQKAVREITSKHNDQNLKCDCPLCQILRVENILEDAFIDYHVGEQWPVLGEYIHIARQKTGSQRPIDLELIARDAKPTYNQMCNLWIACSLYDYDLPKRMSARVRRAMAFLMGKSVEAVQTSHSGLRLQLAVDCWEHLTANFPKRDDPLPRQQPPAPPQQAGQGEQEEAGGEGTAGETGEGSSQGDESDEGEEEDEAGGQAEAEEAEGEEAEPEEAGGSGFLRGVQSP